MKIATKISPCGDFHHICFSQCFEKERAVDAIGRRDRKINNREFVGSDQKRVIVIVDYLPYLAAAAC